jgi:hypothetical protein
MHDEIELDGVYCQYCVSSLENPGKSDVARDEDAAKTMISIPDECNL